MAQHESLVLVTGVSGYLGGQIPKPALKLTCRVELEIVEDIASRRSLDSIFTGVGAVIHVASPFCLTPKDNEKDLLRPAREGTLNILKASACTSSVRKVIITSTMAAISHIGSGPIPGKVYTESDWNPVKWDDAVNSTDGHYVYCASKTFAEQAAWDFMETRKPAFELVSINPAWLIGPFLHHVERFSALNESIGECYHNLVRKQDTLPPTIVQYWVDVRDAAKAHVLALETPAANRRYLVVNRDKFDWRKAFNGIRDRFPEKRFPKDDDEYIVASRPEVDPLKAERQFGFGWIPLAKSFGDMYAQFYELQERGLPE
ncbi:putative uncharacterized oxidoreductase [Lachnellula willkommii]|uniref:Uncharacterized oxidoreductase n=1 Tax=Lachnellula willkommii TaxID=215461 RepID=A0A559MJT5_9HELO|nr:putative uncharacterized oxidoreductase [Lachnellula willkommii]